MRVRRFLHVLLLIGAVGLGWQAWLTWSYSRPPLVTNSPNGFPQALPTISQAGAETARKLASTVIEKNLFSPDRRTQKEEKPKPEETTVPPPQHLKLVGVFVADDRQEAFFTDASKGGKVVRVVAGENLDSYHLTRLTHSEATLTLGKGGQEVSLRMDIQKSREAARAPRIVPSRPQSQPKPQLQREEQEPAETSAPPPTPTYSSILGGNATPAPVLGSGQAAASGALETASGNGQGEALSIRQNIRQLQRRLREIRRQRARERRQTQTDGRG